MDKFLDWFYSVITRPAAALSEVAREKPAGWAFVVYLVTSFFGIALSRSDMQGLGVVVSFTIIIIVGTLLSAASIFLMTGLLHLFSRIFRGKGGYWNLFSAIGFAQFPAVFLPPVHLLGVILGRSGGAFSDIFSIGLLIWIFVLNVIALRESHKLSTGASVATYLLALIALVILVAIPITMYLIAVA